MQTNRGSKIKKFKYVKLDHAFKKSRVLRRIRKLKKNVFNNQGYKVR